MTLQQRCYVYLCKHFNLACVCVFTGKMLCVYFSGGHYNTTMEQFVWRTGLRPFAGVLNNVRSKDANQVSRMYVYSLVSLPPS